MNSTFINIALLVTTLPKQAPGAQLLNSQYPIFTPMKRGMISRGRFMVIITVAALVLVLGILGVVSEGVLHSESDVTGMVVISTDSPDADADAGTANTSDSTGQQEQGGP
jgi:hypothetical protein